MAFNGLSCSKIEIFLHYKITKVSSRLVAGWFGILPVAYMGISCLDLSSDITSDIDKAMITDFIT